MYFEIHFHFHFSILRIFLWSKLTNGPAVAYVKKAWTFGARVCINNPSTNEIREENSKQKMNKKVEKIDEAQQHTAERRNLKRESKFYVI